MVSTPAQTTFFLWTCVIIPLQGMDKNLHRTNGALFRGPFRILWNCRGLRGRILELQNLSRNFDIICLQKTLLSSLTQIKIPGCKCIRLNMNISEIRDLCIFIANQYNFSYIDCSQVKHDPSCKIISSCILLSTLLRYH